MPEGWKIDLQTGFSIGDHFSWALGVLSQANKAEMNQKLSTPISHFDQNKQNKSAQ